MPTYALAAELALCEVLVGELPRPGYPALLRESAPSRWRDMIRFSLELAASAAGRGDVAHCAGLLAQAAIAAAQASLAERGESELNEKGIVARAGLAPRAASVLAAPGDRPFELERSVSAMRVALGVEGGMRP